MTAVKQIYCAYCSKFKDPEVFTKRAGRPRCNSCNALAVSNKKKSLGAAK